MITFEHNEEEDTLICHVYIGFKDEPNHPKTGWYRHEFNRPEDIQDRHAATTGEQLEKEMRKQPKKFGVCDIVERFQKNLQPLNWEKVSGLPSYTNERFDHEESTSEEIVN